MNENKTNTLLLTVIGVATLLVAVIGATFAYFTANLTGTEDDTTVTVGAGILSIAYADGQPAIVASNIIPVVGGAPVASKNFTVTGNNTTDTNMPYSLELIVQSNGFSSNALKYKLASTNTGGNGTIVPAITTETNIATGASTIALGSGMFTGVVENKVHTYVLTLYFPDTGSNQDTEKAKTFTAYVNTKVQAIQTTPNP